MRPRRRGRSTCARTTGGGFRTAQYARLPVRRRRTQVAGHQRKNIVLLGMLAGGIFSAQQGSWNRSTAVGARVMFSPLNVDGPATRSIPFAEGWLDDTTGAYLGRPVDIAQLPDGSLLVSDDAGGATHRIWH